MSDIGHSPNRHNMEYKKQKNLWTSCTYVQGMVLNIKSMFTNEEVALVDPTYMALQGLGIVPPGETIPL